MKTTRPRGFAPWSPRAKNRALIETVNGILDEYTEQLPLTLRQLFYIAVTRSLVAKDEKCYDTLGETLGRARRAQLIPMDAIRDDGFNQADVPGWTSIDNCLRAIKTTINHFTLDRQAGQERRLILWCEASGMAPQLRNVADEYSVQVCSSGGFDSITSKHAIAKAICEDGEPVEVLHIGDYDPSGEHMFSSLSEDVISFANHYNGDIQTTRLAVTPEQIELYDLPTAPPKATDNRSFSGTTTTQAEAIDPVTLAEIVREAIESRQNENIRQAVINSEQTARAVLQNRFGFDTR